MKSFIFATISIACILPIDNVVNARELMSDRHLVTQSNLIAKQPKVSQHNIIPAADLKGIEQAIIERYKRMNKSPEYPAASGGITFYEVKELKISSFLLFDARGSATVEAIENNRGYVFGSRDIADNNQPSNQVKIKKYKYIFSPSTIDPFSVRKITINLSKNDGKWTTN
jgi:hypothetical protein